VSYESDIYSIPRFDAHIEIYGQNESFRFQYETPIVKYLPTTPQIAEHVNGSLEKTMIRRNYENPYTMGLQ
jgi:hypothetical protein